MLLEIANKDVILLFKELRKLPMDEVEVFINDLRAQVSIIAEAEKKAEEAKKVSEIIIPDEVISIKK